MAQRYIVRDERERDGGRNGKQRKRLRRRGKSGYVFVCTTKTKKECISRSLFGTDKLHAQNARRVKKGDPLFLLNVETDTLYGVFHAASKGGKNLVPKAWSGRFPYQVKVRKPSKIHILRFASTTLSRFRINWRSRISNNRLDTLIRLMKVRPGRRKKMLTMSLKSIQRESESEEDVRPAVESTTLWDIPKQSYGKFPKGDSNYPGVTPAAIVYNLIMRYTEPGDVVLDPMAGSGTTIDVCREEGRKCIAFDIAPTRNDIRKNDSRQIPLPNSSVDLIFIDSPYGDNIKYNTDPSNIGEISAQTKLFYDEMESVISECSRVLKPGRVLGWLIGDQWAKRHFTPVGFNVYQRLAKHFETLDVICVVRHAQSSNIALWHSRALRHNFFLRGFKYLFLMKKSAPGEASDQREKARWTTYDRGILRPDSGSNKS